MIIKTLYYGDYKISIIDKTSIGLNLWATVSLHQRNTLGQLRKGAGATITVLSGMYPAGNAETQFERLADLLTAWARQHKFGNVATGQHVSYMELKRMAG